MAERIALLALVGVCGGCSDPDYGAVEYAVATEHFEVLYHPGAPLLCAGEYSAIDELVDTARRAVNYSGSAESVELHMWDFAAPEFPCPSSAAGCVLWSSGSRPVNQAHVRSIGSLHHEVAHAAITSGLTPFYAEGFAETITARIPPTPGLVFDPRPLLDADLTEFDYWQAAVFVNFMIEEFGADLTYAACRAASEQGAESAFSEWTGQSLDAIAEAFMAAPFQCSSQIAWCANPGEVVEDSWVFESAFPCSDEQTLGGDLGEWFETTLDISGGTYLVEIDAGSIVIESCAVCAERTSWALSNQANAEASAEFEFIPGRYSIIIGSAPGFTTHVRFTRLD